MCVDEEYFPKAVLLIFLENILIDSRKIFKFFFSKLFTYDFYIHAYLILFS